MGSKQSQHEPPNPGTVLMWAKGNSSHFSLLSLNVLRAICAYLKHAPCLFWITSTSLHYYAFDLDHPDILQTSPRICLARPIQVNSNSRWAVVNSNQAIVCGGGSGKEAWKSGYLLNRVGGVQALPEMLVGHGCAGMIVKKTSVFVFGSSAAAGERSSEKLYLLGSQWDQLDPMHRARYCFTPAVWQAAIYLCGGQYNNNTIEVLNGSRLHLLEISLPEGGRTLSCVPESTLVVLTLDYLTVLSVRAGLLTCTFKKREGENVLPFTNPVYWQGAIFNIEEGELCQYSVQDGRHLDSQR